MDLLTAYSNSESDENDDIEECGPNEDCKNSSDHEQPYKRLCVEKKQLPLPSFKSTVLSTLPSEDKPQDHPELHEGRVRSFAHERGNWATFVYLNCESLSTPWQPLVEDMLMLLKDCFVVKVIKNFHISLSRTVILQHHWIHLFISSIKDKIHLAKKFSVMLGCIEVYLNEEKTRTFIGLNVVSGYKSLVKCVELLDSCLEEFKLPIFYSNPSFHMSMLWCQGNQMEKIKQYIPQLNLILNRFLSVTPELFEIDVEELHCQIGNKLYSFKLS